MKNLKKITAFLLSCMMIGCTFTACGKDDGDDDDSGKKSTSSSESAEDTSDEDSSEEDTTEDSTGKTTSKKTTEKTTEAKTEATTKDNGGSEDGELEELVIGKWEATKMVSNGTEITDFMGLPMYALMRIEFNDDNMGVISTPMEDTTENFTWFVGEDNTVSVITVDEDGITEQENCKYSNGTLTFSESEDGQTLEIHLKKVDKYTDFDMEKWQQDMQNAFGGMQDDE